MLPLTIQAARNRTTTAIAATAAGLVMLFGAGSAQAAPPAPPTLPQTEYECIQEYGKVCCPLPNSTSWVPRDSTLKTLSGETLLCVVDPDNWTNGKWVVSSRPLGYNPAVLNLTKVDDGPNVPDLNNGPALPEKLQRRR